MAQLVAHLSCKQVVRGSSPLVGSLTSGDASSGVVVRIRSTAYATTLTGLRRVDLFRGPQDERVDGVPAEVNADWLLRQYFPKSTDLSIHTARHLAGVESELNQRPRMVLKDRSPHELFTILLASPHHRSLR